MHFIGRGLISLQLKVQLFPDQDLAQRELTLPEPRAKLLALSLVMVFLVNLADDYRLGQTQDMLWICHISMLLLALGLIRRRTVLIQVASLWIIPGFAFWLVDGFFSGFDLSSSLSHIVALSITILCLQRMHVVRGIWHYAWAYWFGLQMMSRWLTAPVANVNIAHTVRPEAAWAFDAYWQYWLFTTIAAGAGLWFLEMALSRIINRRRLSGG